MNLKSVKNKFKATFNKEYKTQWYIFIISVVATLMALYWIGSSIYNSKYMDALNLSQILIILSATMSVLSFTYYPLVEEKDKNRIKRIGELFFVATVFMILGTMIILIFYIPITIYIPKEESSPLFYIFAGSIPFAIYLEGMVYLFRGVVHVYQYFKEMGIIIGNTDFMPP